MNKVKCKHFFAMSYLYWLTYKQSHLYNQNMSLFCIYAAPKSLQKTPLWIIIRTLLKIMSHHQAIVIIIKICILIISMTLSTIILLFFIPYTHLFSQFEDTHLNASLNSNKSINKTVTNPLAIIFPH